jgi:hypothetical protein
VVQLQERVVTLRVTGREEFLLRGLLESQSETIVVFKVLFKNLIHSKS